MALVENNRTLTTGAAASASVGVGALGILEWLNKGLAFTAMAAGIWCTISLSRYHNKNEKKLDLEIQVLKLKLDQEHGSDTEKEEAK
jgi:hypothetical protein